MSSGEELTGDLTPPMTNGEIVFAEPWQGRVFGMAKAMADADLFTWDEFRAHLIAAIECWERGARGAHGTQGTDEYSYYERFQVALECLLIDRNFIDDESLRARTQTYLARPPGLDHGHSHE